MAGLVPAIHGFETEKKVVDARHNGPVLGPAKPDPSAGHDDKEISVLLPKRTFMSLAGHAMCF
jgi:hypothetical protein